MAIDREELLRHYRIMRDELLAAIANLDDDLLTEPSLDGWSVKNHLTHIATWDEIRASEVVRISAGHASAWRMSGDQETAFNTVTYNLRQGLSLEQARWELETTRQRLLAAIASATPRGLDPSLYGEAALHSTHEAQHTGWIRRWRGEKGL